MEMSPALINRNKYVHEIISDKPQKKFLTY